MTYTHISRNRVIVNKPRGPFLDIYILEDDSNHMVTRKLKLNGHYDPVIEGFLFEDVEPTIRIPTNDQTELIFLLREALFEWMPKHIKPLTKDDIIKTITDCFQQYPDIKAEFDD